MNFRLVSKLKTLSEGDGSIDKIVSQHWTFIDKGSLQKQSKILFLKKSKFSNNRSNRIVLHMVVKIAPGHEKKKMLHLKNASKFDR